MSKIKNSSDMLKIKPSIDSIIYKRLEEIAKEDMDNGIKKKFASDPDRAERFSFNR